MVRMGNKSIGRMAIVAAGLAGLALAGVAEAATVIASSGPSATSYPVGRKVGDNDRITLKPGDAVTVLEPRGTREFKGPGSFRVSLPGRARTNTAFAIFTRARTVASRSTVGGTRTSDIPTQSPNLWFVDLDRPGTYCLTDSSEITFWRADMRGAARYTLVGGGTAPTLSFAKGASLIATDTPFAADQSYTVYRDGEDSPIGATKFVFLDAVPTEPEALADMLIAKGCGAQLSAMSNALTMSPF